MSASEKKSEKEDPRIPKLIIIRSVQRSAGSPKMGNRERMITEEQPERPTVTAVSEMDVRKSNASITSSPTRFIPPKK
ncbi:MAG: hypothetical protein EOO38_30285 [Cytophagaceae bacterium]|nr:MAG: hypothetical protein EOO38_30285 [Cytophagaceae bacterium]